MKIKFYLIVSVLLSFIFILSTNAYSQKSISLDPHETKYINPYKITNNTDKKIFAPYSDKTGNKLLGNLLGNTSVWKSFGTALPNNHTVGGYTISNVGYTKSYGSRSTCNRSCGGGTKSRYVSCIRENGSTVNGTLCGLTSNWQYSSCNTQSCFNGTWKIAPSDYRRNTYSCCGDCQSGNLYPGPLGYPCSGGVKYVFEVKETVPSTCIKGYDTIYWYSFLRCEK